MLNYFWKDRPEGEVSAYFMPGAGGPCRFGQYNVFSRRLIERHRIPDAAVLTLNAANGYMGLGDRFTLPAWRAIVISDVMYEIWSTLLAAAAGSRIGPKAFFREWDGLVAVIHLSWKRDPVTIEAVRLSALSRIPLKMPYHEIPKISLIGEIYVRNDPISLAKSRGKDGGSRIHCADLPDQRMDQIRGLADQEPASKGDNPISLSGFAIM